MQIQVTVNTKIQENAFYAHCVRGVPPSEIMIPYPSIRSLLDSQVRRYGDRVFLISHGRNGIRSEVSFDQFFGRVSQAANYLESRGVSCGDRVAIPCPLSTGQSGTDINILVQYFATWMVGAVSVPLAVDLTSGNKSENRTSYLLGDSQASDAFLGVDDPFLDVMDGFSSEFTIGKKSKLDDEVLIMYTPDTQGTWKGVLLSHYNVLVDGMAIAEWHRLVDDQPVSCNVPVSGTAGIVGCVMSVLYAGCPLLLSEENHLGRILDHMAKERVQAAFVNSATLDEWLHADVDPDQYDLSALRHLIAPHHTLTADVVRETRKKLGMRVIPGFELPEATCFSSFLPVSLRENEFLERMQNDRGLPVGAALHPTEMSILDRNGKQVSEGKEGFVAIRGHNVMKGYLNDEKRTADVFRYGWLLTEEKGFYELDPEGNMFFTVT